jgi:uncharacterized membrane protein
MFVEDDDFRSIPKNEATYENNYESGYSCFSRHTLILHGLGYLLDIISTINQNKEESSTKTLTNEQVKQIKL